MLFDKPSAARPSYSELEPFKAHLLLASIKKFAGVVRLVQVWLPKKKMPENDVHPEPSLFRSLSHGASRVTKAVCIPSSYRRTTSTRATPTRRPNVSWMETSRTFSSKECPGDPVMPADLEDVVLECTGPSYCNHDAFKSLATCSKEYTFTWGDGSLLGRNWKWGQVQMVQDLHAMPSTIYHRHKTGRFPAARESVVIPVYRQHLEGDDHVEFVCIVELFLGGTWSEHQPGHFQTEMHHVSTILGAISATLSELGLRMASPRPAGMPSPVPSPCSSPMTSPTGVGPKDLSRDDIKRRARAKAAADKAAGAGGPGGAPSPNSPLPPSADPSPGSSVPPSGSGSDSDASSFSASSSSSSSSSGGDGGGGSAGSSRRGSCTGEARPGAGDAGTAEEDSAADRRGGGEVAASYDDSYGGDRVDSLVDACRAAAAEAAAKGVTDFDLSPYPSRKGGSHSSGGLGGRDGGAGDGGRGGGMGGGGDDGQLMGPPAPSSPRLSCVGARLERRRSLSDNLNALGIGDGTGDLLV